MSMSTLLTAGSRVHLATRSAKPTFTVLGYGDVPCRACAFDGSNDQQLFPHHLVGRLVRTQPAPTRLTKPAVSRAFAVAHFADQFRPDERHAFRVLGGKPCVER